MVVSNVFVCRCSIDPYIPAHVPPHFSKIESEASIENSQHNKSYKIPYCLIFPINQLT